MKTDNTTKSISLMILTALLAFSAIALPVSANDSEEHADHMEVSSDEAARVAAMQQLVVLMQQLIELLMAEADHNEMSEDNGHVHDDSHAHDEGEDTETLAVWVEIHSNMSHAHVQEVDAELVTFFLDDLAYTEEEAIIEAIAEETGLAVDDIAAVITFPSGVLDENGDSVEGTEDLDLEGIHIMGNGDVMLGNGEVVEGAAVNDDDMIVLEDGTLVEPEFDLR